MLNVIQTLLPEPEQWLGLVGLLASLVIFCGLGQRVADRGEAIPGTAVLAGWSIVAIVLTLVGTLTDWPFAPAFWLTAGAGVSLALLAWRGDVRVSTDLVRICLLGAPLVLVIAGKAPTEVDSFTHWLPNGAYILDFDRFPAGDRPASQSAYPGFPYNTTFLFYMVGRIAGEFIENAVIVFNVVLLLLFAGALAWLIRRGTGEDRAAGWGIAAIALLAATLLNPVFVRRIWLTSYCEMATSVVVAFAGLVAWLWIQALARREPTEAGRALTLGLLLALLVNIKQANPVLVAAIVAGAALVAWRDRALGLRRFARRLPLVLGPAALLYGLWRYYVSVPAGLKEAVMLPVAEWPWHNLPSLFGHMATVVVDKSPYFMLATAMTVWAVRVLLRRPGSDFDRLMVIVAATVVVYNVFLVFIFIAHFGGYPQSYWRLNTHVGYLVTAAAVYSLTLAWDRWGRARLRLTPRALKFAAVGLVVALPVAELALAGYWRFDLEAPRPIVRASGKELARTLPQGAAVVAVIPGDQGNFSEVLEYYATRERRDLRVAAAVPEEEMVVRAIADLAGRPLYVWAYCAQPWMTRLFALSFEPGQALLIRRDGNRWSVDRAWKHAASGSFGGVYKLFDRSRCGSESKAPRLQRYSADIRD